VQVEEISMLPELWRGTWKSWISIMAWNS